MSTTQPRSNSHRGLLAGLLALVLFASTAVAMTARGSAGATSNPPLSQADRGRPADDPGRTRDGDAARSVVLRDGDGRGAGAGTRLVRGGRGR
jgi:hypothetical protein